MLTYLVANAEQIGEFIQLLRCEAADYLNHVSQLMQMTPEQFAHLVRTVGQVCSVYRDGDLVGFYWIEERDRVVHLHGLAVMSARQGKGIGTEVLQMLADKYKGSMDAIELGVHDSSTRARALYEGLGYKTVKRLDDLGFSIMQRPL